jgi:arylsulfatase A-like enzyme
METNTKTRMRICATALLVLGGAISCGGDPEHDVLSANVPLHLEDHLDAAELEGSEIPANLPQLIEWSFGEPQPDWRAAEPAPEDWKPVEIAQVEGALRLTLAEANTNQEGQLDGTIFVELPPGMRFEDWGDIEVRARSADPMRTLGASYNYDEEDPILEDSLPFHFDGDRTPILADGGVHTYRLSLDRAGRRVPNGAWTHLALWCTTETTAKSAAFDILSVRILPREADFASKRSGIRMVGRHKSSDTEKVSPDRRALYTHAPARIAYRVKVPREGRLDVGLGVVRGGQPVRFRIAAEPVGGASEALLDETWSEPSRWSQHAIDLSHLAGQIVTLTLEATADRAGSVALWASPTLSGTRATDRPNIIFYVIDGGGADYMSAFGYPRRTTPNLERIAAEGAVFDRAHSNSSWTRPSTASLLTSLHHSVLGGLRNQRNPVPAEAITMAEHMHRAGYLTAEFTANPNAGRMSDLDRGLDAFREAGVKPTSLSSVELHENFWTWRDNYPAEPYWVHFQPTDVHNDHTSVSPFAGLYINPERRTRFEKWLAATEEIPSTDDVRMKEALQQIGVDPLEFWAANRDLHDETMAHQDHRLGELVERLKETGEWENTLLIVAADHSVAAGAWDYNLHMRDPAPPHVYHDDTATPILRSGVSHIPLIFVWPGKIEPGRRFADPVSMIDMLPTVLELASLPQPEIVQGRSLAPLLLGEPGWKPYPVVFDEFEVDPKTGEYRGRIEMIDGRWGASLEIHPPPDQHPRFQRDAPLLLFDLWKDPNCLRSLHEERPDLVEHYTALLLDQWKNHQELAKRFSVSEGSALTSEQLEALKALGYVGESQ